MNIFSKTAENAVIFTILFLVLLLAFIKGPAIAGDSGSYEGYSIVRIGMYPLLISFFKFFFKAHAFKSLAIFQTILTISAAYGLSNFLKSQFKLPFYVYTAIICVFLFPSVSHAAAWDILSESISYPFFLLTIWSFLKVLNYKRKVDVTIFSTLLFLLCFTRQQFIFFYVVSFIYNFYLLAFEKNRQFSRQLLLKTSLSLFTFFIAERSYHAIYHGHFAGTPFVGTQFLMRPLFVASTAALNSIDEPKQKQFIKEVTTELIKNNIINPDQPSKEPYAYEYFYNTMYHKISSKIWRQVWSKDVLDKALGRKHTDFQVQQIIDHNALMMGIKLIKVNFLQTMIYYIKDTIRGMGGYTCFFFMMILSICCVAAGYKSKKLNLLYLSILCSILMHLGNSSLVCLFEPPLTRYVYATNAFFFVMVIIFLTKLLPYLSPQDEELCAQ